MAKLSVMPINGEDTSLEDWYQVMDVDGLNPVLGKADRENFNYSVEHYTKENYDNAYKGFSELANKDCVSSQHFLGVMYLKSYGVLQDFVCAHSWFNIVASKGHKKARSISIT